MQLVFLFFARNVMLVGQSTSTCKKKKKKCFRTQRKTQLLTAPQGAANLVMFGCYSFIHSQVAPTPKALSKN